jgi:CheY-like chemotaxis protein
MSSDDGRKSPRVLCVDTKQSNLLARKKLLELYGCEVFDAEDLRSSIELVTRERIDLVIMEYHIAGDLNGYQLATGIRKLFPEVALIMLTADIEIPDSACDVVDRVFVKGWYEPRYMVEAIAELLPHRRLGLRGTA